MSEAEADNTAVASDLDSRSVRLASGLIVALINLRPDEIKEIEEALSQFDIELRTAVYQTIGEPEHSFSNENPLLIVYRVDEHRKRPDQDVRKLRRMLSDPIPILLLILPEHARRVQDYLRAGADEYWILPLGSDAFPPRLQVLLEWGQSVIGKGRSSKEGKSIVEATGTICKRMWRGLLDLFAVSNRTQAAPHGDSAFIVGKWEKVRRLGFGSYGEVWLVRDRGSNASAVAKMPHSPKLNTKFIREAAILKRLLGHPNAVTLKEVVKEDEKVILIQEYVEGATLQDLLGRSMDGATKEKAFLELLDVVAYAHKQNIMHRDIKPENIIIAESGALKLLDFGTGKDLTRRSISNTVIGSRPFMAPEQIMGKSRLASDVWALGVILYALATGFLPFYDDNEKQLMDMILEESPEPPGNLEPGLREELESVILRCLEKDWSRRYKDAVELKDEILSLFPDFGHGRLLPS